MSAKPVPDEQIRPGTLLTLQMQLIKVYIDAQIATLMVESSLIHPPDVVQPHTVSTGDILYIVQTSSPSSSPLPQDTRDRLQTSKGTNKNPAQHRHLYAPVLLYNNGPDPRPPQLLILILQQRLPLCEGKDSLTLNFLYSIVPYLITNDEDTDY
ncbi:Hypothetical predicted protein [Pelobates cultripes]|uniref:Uncharacterized protein n=1 Tax=Pelobates cultripes TaxID=61616 RepID=A0AAD1WRX5_PELCU|nr:Hypothetical predicted protein [Pelobates cultripes]